MKFKLILRKYYYINKYKKQVLKYVIFTDFVNFTFNIQKILPINADKFMKIAIIG